MQERGDRTESQDAGFMLVGLIVAIFLILLVLSIAAPTVAKELRRDRELEAIHRGNQYVRAVQLYYRKVGHYPGSIEQLEKTNNIRFLRQRYPDPMTGKPDWKLIHQGEAKTTVKGFFGKPLSGLNSSGGLGSASGMSSGGSVGAGATGSSSGSSFGSSSFGSWFELWFEFRVEWFRVFVWFFFVWILVHLYGLDCFRLLWLLVWEFGKRWFRLWNFRIERNQQPVGDQLQRNGRADHGCGQRCWRNFDRCAERADDLSDLGVHLRS